jgi:alkylation response protein AidB-like acyl-CoA dehydrogenase
MSLLDGRLSEDQRAFQDSARGFSQEQMAPFAAEWDADSIFPEEALRAGAA